MKYSGFHEQELQSLYASTKTTIGCKIPLDVHPFVAEKIGFEIASPRAASLAYRAGMAPVLLSLTTQPADRIHMICTVGGFGWSGVCSQMNSGEVRALLV